MKLPSAKLALWIAVIAIIAVAFVWPKVQAALPKKTA